MFGILILSFYNSLKILNSNYYVLKILKKKFIFKNLNFFFFKTKLFFFLNKKFRINFLKIFFKKLINFLKGFKIYFIVQGRRFKYYINSKFIFFKMDTSKYICLPLLNNIFLKKTKEMTKMFFFNINIFQLIKKIQNLKIPSKYTKRKKGIFFINN